MPKTNTLAEHTEPTVLQLLETAAQLERQLDSVLANTRGISFSEYRLLALLVNAGEQGLPRIELAKGVGLTASAITRALKPLIKLGYVGTAKSERDARQSRALVTKAGRGLVHDAHAALQDQLRASPINQLPPASAIELQRLLAQMRQTR